MKKLYGIIFSLILVLFTGYVLADTFLLTNSYQVVEENDDVKVLEPPKEEETISTDDYYKDSNIEIKITKTREYNTNIYMADIKIRDAEYLKTALQKILMERILLNIHQRLRNLKMQYLLLMETFMVFNKKVMY